MGRLVWLSAGVVLGYVALRRIGVVRATPGDIAGQAAGKVAGIAGEQAERSARSALAAARDFVAEVRGHAAEREAELRAALTSDVTDPDTGAYAGSGMDRDAARGLLEHPHSRS